MNPPFTIAYQSILVLALIAVTPILAASQAIGSYERQRGQIILDQIKKDIQENYYDKNFHGINLDEVFKAADAKMKAAQSNGQLFGIVAQAVFALNDSHTFFAPPDRKTIVDYGFELTIIGDAAYVNAVKEKSDASAKGLKVGDMVYLIDGYQPARENIWKLIYLYYALRPQPGVKLTVASPGGEPRELEILSKVTDRKQIDLTNYDDYMDLVREGENEQRDRKLNHRTKQIDGVFIWKMPAFNLSENEVDAMIDKVGESKALILDLRGNAGGYESTLLRLIGNLFDHDVKIGEIARRKETKPFLAKTRGNKAFKGRLIVMVDSVSASSSEILARTVQLEKRGTVIGDRSSGAVMRARFFQHAAGLTSVALYGVSVTDADVRMSDGATLEGTGITPDEVQLPTGADLFAKRDPILAYAAQLVGLTMDAEKAGALFPELKKK